MNRFQNIRKHTLTALFVTLYAAVGLVSCYHAIGFFGVANRMWLATILAIAFEVGQAAVLFALLSDRSQSKKAMPWILMLVLTVVQIMGNVVASYRYITVHNPEEIQYFVDSIMFFMADPDPQVNTVILSYIIGAILPVVALCMTGMIVGISGLEERKEESTRMDAESSNSDIRMFL